MNKSSEIYCLKSPSYSRFTGDPFLRCSLKDVFAEFTVDDVVVNRDFYRDKFVVDKILTMEHFTVEKVLGELIFKANEGYEFRCIRDEEVSPLRTRGEPIFKFLDCQVKPIGQDIPIIEIKRLRK